MIDLEGSAKQSKGGGFSGYDKMPQYLKYEGRETTVGGIKEQLRSQNVT
jgi:hypothetical protein